MAEVYSCKFFPFILLPSRFTLYAETLIDIFVHHFSYHHFRVYLVSAGHLEPSACFYVAYTECVATLWDDWIYCVAYTKCVATLWDDRIYCVAYTECVATLWDDGIYIFVNKSRRAQVT